MKSPFDVSLSIETKMPFPLSQKKIKKISKNILRHSGWTRGELHLRLMSDKQIAVINKNYLNHEGPTDVISFSYVEKSLSGKGKRPPFFGDLVISLDTALRQSKIYGHSFFYEFCFYLCHGILHISGYDDRTTKDRNRMLKKQEQILRRTGVKR